VIRADWLWRGYYDQAGRCDKISSTPPTLQEEAKMALLPYLDDKDASPEIREAFSARPFVLNVQRMTANAQKIFMHRARLSTALFSQTTLNPKLREITILRTAKDCHSVYEWTQHVPAARHVGVSEGQIAAIENWQSAKCFSELERLVLQFTDEVNANVKASRAALDGLKKHLSPGEIIELLIIIGHWRQTASILETTEVDLEDFAGKVNILERQPSPKK
jgi:alkylhydroperoxidase family enzyme